MTNDEFHAIKSGDKLRKTTWAAGQSMTVMRAVSPFVRFHPQEGLPQGMHIGEIAEWEAATGV